MTELTPKSAIEEIKGVGKVQEKRFNKLNIFTLKDLLFHIPFRYQDTSEVNSIETFLEKEDGTFLAEIVYAKRIGRGIVSVRVKDDTKFLTLSYFNQPYVASALKEGDIYIFDGKVTRKNNRKNIYNPKFEKLKEDVGEQTHLGKLIGIYHETKGLSSRNIRNILKTILPDTKELILDPLPSKLLEENNLISLPNAISKIHNPDTVEDINKARERLAFDEMLYLSTKVEEQKKYFKKLNAQPIKIKSGILNKYIKTLPYKLTGDQNSAIEKILESLHSDQPSNILLNGDVGSGKTVVAASAILNTIKNGYSAILLAPTTVLAKQHYDTFQKLFKDLNIEIDLCISKNKIISDADNKLIIGTHAVLYQKDLPPDLNLVIIDEQHRFGVEQREYFRQKNKFSPHYITMTATPIPRSLTEIFFGNLDVIEIKEKPSIRKEIKTFFTPYKKRNDCFEWINKHISDSKEAGKPEQAFIIYPLIEDSANYSSKSVLTQYEILNNENFKNLKVEYLHGRLKEEDKTRLLEDFKKHKFDILVSTTVIEVGIDIPDATIIVIEDAEKFGLAQLHQLRGRVGRSNKQSYCYVVPGLQIENEEKVKERLKYFADHPSGFDVAEYDLQTRGPGEVYGTLQSGTLNFKVASIQDIATLKKARSVAKKILKEDNSHEYILENLFR